MPIINDFPMNIPFIVKVNILQVNKCSYRYFPIMLTTISRMIKKHQYIVQFLFNVILFGVCFQIYTQHTLLKYKCSFKMRYRIRHIYLQGTFPMRRKLEHLCLPSPSYSCIFRVPLCKQCNYYKMEETVESLTKNYLSCRKC